MKVETKFDIDEVVYVKNERDGVSKGKICAVGIGEHWFDEYWMNYKKITVQDGNGGTKKISTLREFVEYKNGDVSLIVEKRNGEE